MWGILARVFCLSWMVHSPLEWWWAFWMRRAYAEGERELCRRILADPNEPEERRRAAAQILEMMR